VNEYRWRFSRGYRFGYLDFDERMVSDVQPLEFLTSLAALESQTLIGLQMLR